jgi:hypothetical protein
MGNRFRGSRFGRGRGRSSQARPMAAERPGGPGPRTRVWLGWAAAVVGVVLVAFLVGRAGSESGLPSPTPSPSAEGPLPIVFGTALDPATGEAVGATDRYRAGDRIAYSVRLPAAPGVGTILVEIARLEAGHETIVQQPSEQGIVASSPVIGFTFAVATGELIDAWGPGDYAMRIYLPGAVDPFAAGRFILVETPTAS